MLGATPAFLQGWPVAWGLSWLIAFPVLLLALPAARKLTAMLVAPAGSGKRKGRLTPPF